jgi:FkbM family methyltransferase
VSKSSVAGRVLRALSVLRTRDALSEAIASNFFSIASFRVVRALSQYQSDFATIIDVGANRGQFSVAAARRYPRAAIHAFEPIEGAFRQLQKNIARYPNVTAHHKALGGGVGSVRFFQNQFDQVSSALEIDPANHQPYFDHAAVRRISVKMDRLDRLAPELNFERPTLLKLDVQGYEKQVLCGARDCLSSIDYLVLELAFVPLYRDQPLFAEMHDFLNQLGFEVVGPLGFNEGAGQMIIEMDFLYRRREGLPTTRKRATTRVSDST